MPTYPNDAIALKDQIALVLSALDPYALDR
jgi:hypothetical protein